MVEAGFQVETLAGEQVLPIVGGAGCADVVVKVADGRRAVGVVRVPLQIVDRPTAVGNFDQLDHVIIRVGHRPKPLGRRIRTVDDSLRNARIPLAISDHIAICTGSRRGSQVKRQPTHRTIKQKNGPAENRQVRPRQFSTRPLVNGCIVIEQSTLKTTKLSISWLFFKRIEKISYFLNPQKIRQNNCIFS